MAEKKSQIEKSLVGKLMKVQIPKMKESVKRRIDFNENELDRDNEQVKRRINSQLNNNATCKNRSALQRNPRNRKIETRSSELTDALNSDRVQWTKEFLEKVRKSNERHKKVVDCNKGAVTVTVKEKPDMSGRMANKVNANVQPESSLQNREQIVEVVSETSKPGDGIETVVEVDMQDMEELDYEDDLTDIDEQGFPDNEISEVEENEGQVSPKAG